MLHVGHRAGYDAAHIPGARPITEEDVARPHDMAKGELMLELPEPAVLRATLAARGISDDSVVIVYAGKDVPLQSATRILFTLDYLGLGAQSSLLNGGLAAWQAAGHPTTTVATAVTPGRLSARPTAPVVVDAAFVQSLAGRANYTLVDARAPVFYAGTEPTFGKRGHIPRAINIPVLGDRRRAWAGRAAGSEAALCRRGREAWRHHRGLLPRRAAGHGRRARGPASGDSGRALRRRVPGLGVQQPRRGGAMTRYTDPLRGGRRPRLVLLAAYGLAGQGLGASGGFASVAAPVTAAIIGTSQAAASPAVAPYLPHGLSSPLRDWLVWELAGVALGAFLSAWRAGRLARTVERGTGVTTRSRVVTAVAGGIADGRGRQIRARVHQRSGAVGRRAAVGGQLDLHRHRVCRRLRRARR